MRTLVSAFLVVVHFLGGIFFGVGMLALNQFSKWELGLQMLFIIWLAAFVILQLVDRNVYRLIDRLAAVMAGGSIGFFTVIIAALVALNWEMGMYADETQIFAMIIGGSIISILLFGCIAYVVKWYAHRRENLN